MSDPPLPSVLLGRVLERLGLGATTQPDLAGLRAVYGAWCAHVPFDNVRKTIALRTAPERPLPGIEAADFFEAWLAHGAGGTCWPTSNALFALVEALGFRARRVAGSMRDVGVPNHGSVKVELEGRDWLVDSSMQTGVPLPLDGGLYVGDNPVLPVEVEAVQDTHVVWVHSPPNASHLPCRLLLDPVDHDFYRAAYEASRESSPFNRHLYARRHHPGELRVLLGHTRFRRAAGGLDQRELTRAELRRALQDDIGLGEELIESWAHSGSLELSFEPPPAGARPPDPGLPPSRR